MHRTTIFIFAFSLLLPLVATAQPSINGWEWRYLKKLESNRTTGGVHFNQTISDLSEPLALTFPIAYLTTRFITKDSLLKVKGLTLLSSFAINVGFTYTLKKIINRPRPSEIDPRFTVLTPAASRSFPSGHTAEAFSLATTLTLLHPKWYVIIPSYTFAGLVGYSRMYLGAHYPSDVIAGAVVGAGAAWLNHQLIKHWQLHKRRLAVR